MSETFLSNQSSGRLNETGKLYICVAFTTYVAA